MYQTRRLAQIVAVDALHEIPRRRGHPWRAHRVWRPYSSSEHWPGRVQSGDNLVWQVITALF